MTERREPTDSEERRSTYSLVSRAAPGFVLDALRAFFGGRRDVTVIVNRRKRERRRGSDRRAARAPLAEAEDRRRIRSQGGRRVGEQRAELVPVDPPPDLPRRLAEHARFAERRPAGAQTAEDVDTARLVTRLQAGDRGAFDEIYERYLARVYGYLRVALRDEHEAEDAAHEVFVLALQALPRYELRGVPFRMWLFRIVRNYTLNHARRHARTDVMPADEVSRHIDQARPLGDLEGLGLAEDAGLLRLIRSLPLTQRQVIVLRYVMDFDMNEIATILGRSPNAVSQVHRRAFATLRSRLLAARGGSEAAGERLDMRRRTQISSVTLARRLAMTY